MKKNIFFSIFFFLSFPLWATHNRAGEILYRSISNTNPFRIEITIITYTKTGGTSDGADRCDLEVDFDDGTVATVSRTNGLLGVNCPAGVGSGVQVPGVSDIKKNVYIVIHEFPGPGTYNVSMEDPMRNESVQNIPNSGSVPFYLQSAITIDVSTGANNSPTLSSPPIDNACLGLVFEHNPGAIDIDGDSLVYSIVSSKSYGGQSIPGYSFPDQIEPGTDNQLSINAQTGTLVWDSPQQLGEYNVAILIEEYRTNPNSGQIFKVGEVMRDLQIEVGICENNSPPTIENLTQVCLTAGEFYSKTIIANDIDGDFLTFSGSGYPVLSGNGGVLSPDSSIYTSPPAELEFRWLTSCDQVRSESYWMYFKAKEDRPGNSGLADFEELEIRIVSPAVEILEIIPVGNSLQLTWSEAECDRAVSYSIYRYTDSLGYEANNCEVGVPAELGYVLAGEVDGISNTSFKDDNKGLGLTHGKKYCYMIVTVFRDGMESYPSLEQCGELIRDVPILNKVSIGITDLNNGVDTVSWIKPIDLREDIFGPPYQYRLSRIGTQQANEFVVFESNIDNDLDLLDTFYVGQGLNTEELTYTYKIELLSGIEKISVGNSGSASSIYLSSAPSDNTLSLFWKENVPWENSDYLVYRFSNESAPNDTLIFLDTVQNSIYVDSNLANLKEYKYLVQSLGNYSSTSIPGQIRNNSQIHTGIPIDNEPPCSPPNQAIEGDCSLAATTIEWENSNTSCAGVDDVLAYNVYYSPVLGQAPTILETINSSEITRYSRDFQESIAGCYAITAIDSFNNESEFGEVLCIDNCPEYELPNIFTPGRDGVNDFFKPFPYKFVKDINITIYNRWGAEVFSSNDPDIMWEGLETKTGKELPSGIYYYVCTVNEIRLTGIVPRELRSYVQLMRQKEVNYNSD